MKSRFAPICLLILATAIASFGQGRQAQSRQYDPATEVTVSGVVQDIFQPTGMNGNSGTHFNLKTAGGMIEVHAGPEWFMAQQHFSLESGITLSATGSKQVMAGKQVLIARELKVGDKILTLRDANGLPQWSRRSAASN